MIKQQRLQREKGSFHALYSVYIVDEIMAFYMSSCPMYIRLSLEVYNMYMYNVMQVLSPLAE